MSFFVCHLYLFMSLFLYLYGFLSLIGLCVPVCEFVCLSLSVSLCVSVSTSLCLTATNATQQWQPKRDTESTHQNRHPEREKVERDRTNTYKPSLTTDI